MSPAEPSRVRSAVAADFPGIMALCRLLHAENGPFPWSEGKVETMLGRALRRDRVQILVIGPEGAPVACLALFLGDVWYSDAVVVEEIFNFVHPEHRRTGHARALIEAAKRVSDSVGAPLMIGVISNERTEAKVRLYSRHLKPAGAFFIHNAHLAAPDIGEA